MHYSFRNAILRATRATPATESRLAHRVGAVSRATKPPFPPRETAFPATGKVVLAADISLYIIYTPSPRKKILKKVAKIFGGYVRKRYLCTRFRERTALHK